MIKTYVKFCVDKIDWLVYMRFGSLSFNNIVGLHCGNRNHGNTWSLFIKK